MRKTDELFDIYEHVEIKDDTTEICADIGTVFIVKSNHHKNQLWARRFCGPFYVESDVFELPSDEAYVFMSPAPSTLSVRLIDDGDSKIVCEDVEVKNYPLNNVNVLINRDVPFGADPREEPVILFGVFASESSSGSSVTGYVTAGLSWRQYKILEAAATYERPSPFELFEYFGLFFDPVRSAGLTLNSMGHMFFVDDVGTGKSKLIEAMSVTHTSGRGATEAALTWNARDKTPGILLREPGGFVGWDELDKSDLSEIQKFLIDALNFKIVRKVAGFLAEVEHYCRFLFAGNKIPSFSEGTLHAFLSRMQYIGGVAGDIRDEIPYDMSQEAVESVRESVADKFVGLHTATVGPDSDEINEVSREIYKYVIERFRKDIGKSIARALMEVTNRFPPDSEESSIDGTNIEGLLEYILSSGDIEIDDDFIKSCAFGHVHDKVRRFCDSIAVMGLEECGEMVREAFSYTELEDPGEDDIEACVKSWLTSLENNYSTMCGDKVPLPKIAETPLWEEDDISVKWEEVV